jgi:16S rRNA (guanine527-N7)-methyltransferase
MSYKYLDVPHGTIDRYIELLLQWNEKINLVSIKDRQELIDRHILDALQLVKYIDKDKVVFDIGSGAGFPGLMLSYAGIKKVNLVEKIGKKANFLLVAASLSRNEVEVHNSNVENINTSVCDVITARGFANLNDIFELTKNIAKENTKYILLKGKKLDQEIKNALEKWSFKYIIHKSETSNEGFILEVEHLKRNEKKDYCSSKSKGRSG